MKIYHSRAYHRFFEGYNEKLTANEEGKLEIKRFYSGDYYIPELSEKERRTKKIGIFILYISAVLLFFFGGLQNVTMNSSRYMAFVQMTVLLIFGALLFWMAPLWKKDGHLTFRDYKDLKVWMKKSCLIAAILLWTGVLAGLVEMAIQGRKADEDVFVAAAALFLSGFSLYAIYLWEKKSSYQIQTNEKKGEPKSVMIRY